MSKDRGKPRTGTGDAPRGRKPQKGELFMVNKEGRPKTSQPKGWGIAKVIDLFTGKTRK